MMEKLITENMEDPVYPNTFVRVAAGTKKKPTCSMFIYQSVKVGGRRKAWIKVKLKLSQYLRQINLI